MWVPQLPARLWWSHNTHYHRWLLRQLPAHLDRALDVGCGAGRLAGVLASRASHVDAVDSCAAMIAVAHRCCADQNSLRFITGDILDDDLPLAEVGYDAVTAISSLHHLPLDDGLDRLTGLVRPGGVLVVVGHFRPDTATDRFLDVLALPANFAVGVALAATGRGGKPDEAGMPVTSPNATLAQVRAAASRLPGAQLKRAVFWRYLLVWRAPPAR